MNEIQAPGTSPFGLGLYKILVHFEAFFGGVNHPYAPPPPAKPTLLQYYCTPNAQYTTPSPTPVCMPYTIQYW